MTIFQTDFLIGDSVPQAAFGGDLLLPAIILGLVAAALLALLVFVIFRYFRVRYTHGRHGHEPSVVLRVLLPKFRREEDSERSVTIDQVREMISIAETFFSSIGGLKAQKKFRHWLLGRTDEMSFEIVARDKQIWFYIEAPRVLQQFVEQQLASSYSDAFIEEVEDYNIFSPAGTILGSYLVLKRPVAFPIKTYMKLESDPLNALTNALGKVQDGEGAVIQYVVRSARKEWRQAGLTLAHNMQQGISLEDAQAGKSKGGKGGWLSAMGGGKPQEQQQQEQYRLSPLEEEAVKGVEEKASKAGMDANIRLVVSAPTPVRAEAMMQNLLNAFAQYNIYQFGNAFDKVIPPSKKRVITRFIHRSFDERYRIVLNTEELASLWHLPLPTTETPNIHWLLARSGPAPVDVPPRDPDNLFLGVNVYRGRKTEISLKRPDRQRHMYVIGKSGTGKSVFISGLAIQDIKRGDGVCVVDPHGDLIEHILEHIPKERVDDVIVFDPSDMERPMGLNMLESKEESMKDFAVQEMISIFYKLFPPEMIGPMFEHDMRNVMLTLMADPNENGTIAEIPRMFTDEAFTKKWVAKLKDPVVRSYWENEVAKTSDFHKSEKLGYLVSKVGRFVENEMMRNIIGQQKSSFDIREVMDKQKILLVNLAKGRTGEVNAKLLGLIIVSKLQMAAMGRADIPEEERKDFYLYIDEFQNFITDSIATILSEARKYRLCLILAHQYLSQLTSQDGKTEVRDAVLGNVGTTLVARIGPEDVEVLEKLYTPNFSGFDLINSDKFTWYVKMIIDNSQAKPFTMRSVPSPKGDHELAAAIKQLSRLKYGRDRAIVEAEILERSALGGSSAPSMDLPPIER